MHVNRTRIILIVMIIATVLLGGAAIFIGWRLQSQVNTNTFASCRCPDPVSNWEGPDQWNKCWSKLPGQTGVSTIATCDDTTQTTTTGSAVGGTCTEFCCYPGNQGCVKAGGVDQNGGPTKCPGLIVTNAGGVDIRSCPADGGVIVGGGSTAKTKAECDEANGCWNDGTAVRNYADRGCTLPGAEWCGPGNCVAGRTDLCKYRCTNKVAVNTNTACVAGSCQAGYCLSVSDPNGPTFGECVAGKPPEQELCVASPAQTCKLCDCSADNKCDYNNGQECRKNCRTVACNVTIPNCAQLDFNCQAGGDCGGSNINKCANCATPPGPASLTCYKCTDAANDGNACSSQTVTSSSCPSGWTTNSNCASQATGGACPVTTQNTCYKCTDSEEDGNTCQTQTTTGTCASLGAGWTSNSLCETAATGGSCVASIQAKVRGRVYCQDTTGPLIPIANTVVAITKGSTTINATTDSDGFYVSSNISLPSGGDKVSVAIGSLPSTFNNGLNTSQLTGKSALNCATVSSLPGCSTGVASNYYCDSVSTKGSYANCKITTAGDPTSGHGRFDFKYTNCVAASPSCGDSVVDSGEACDPVGTVGQCSNGGKCQTGCACPTCNSACSTNDDCPDGLVCSGNKCRNPGQTSAVDCKVTQSSVPSTGLLDENLPVILVSLILMVLGVLVVRNQGAISLMTNVAVSLFGTNILRYVDPDGAKRYYEKNILNKQKHEAE